MGESVVIWAHVHLIFGNCVSVRIASECIN